MKFSNQNDFVIFESNIGSQKKMEYFFKILKENIIQFSIVYLIKYVSVREI